MPEKCNLRALFCIFIISLGGFLFGSTTIAIAGALPFISNEFSLSTAAQGVTVSMILFGALIGSMLGGAIADRFGRKGGLFITAIIIILGTLIAAYSSTHSIFLTGRFLTGIGIGISSLISPLYLAEIAPARIRGGIVSFNQLMITIGALLAFIVGHVLTPSQNWRGMISMSLWPSLLLFLGLFLVPESPAWLKTRGLFDQALSNTMKLRKAGTVIEDQIIEEHTKKGKWSDLLAPSLRMPLLIGIVLSIIQVGTGINAIMYYAPKIFQESGMNPANSMLAVVGLGSINVLATVFSLWLVNRLGRRPILFIGLSGMIVSLCALSLSALCNSNYVEIISIISLFNFLIFFAISLGPVTWIILSEIYPRAIRGRAMSLGVFCNWLTNYVISLTFLTLMKAIGIGGTFGLFAIAGVLSLAFIYRFVPETKGKTLEEIERSV